MAFIFTSEREYIDSRTTLAAKIAAIDNIINTLISTAANAAVNEDVTEYWLNDGQTQIKTIYRSMTQVEASIQKFIRLKNIYVNQYTGRVNILMDRKNFNGNGGQ